jgi:acyl-CoA synthetase (AMP-forming)/AMP-acid ligase II
MGDTEVRYGELNDRTNRLARYLRGIGIQHETLVGSCFDNSTAAVVSILGLLKAGAVPVFA